MADCLTANGMPEEALELLGVSAFALGRGASERGADEQEEVVEAKVVLDTVLLNSGVSTRPALIPKPSSVVWVWVRRELLPRADF
jgi:hypothetical protein